MPWWANFLEKVWTRDGLFGLIAIGLIVFIGWMYFVEFKAMRAQLDEVTANQIRACIRSGIKPIEACWPHTTKEP